MGCPVREMNEMAQQKKADASQQQRQPQSQPAAQQPDSQMSALQRAQTGRSDEVVITVEIERRGGPLSARRCAAREAAMAALAARLLGSDQA
jgi:hypothetical protein